MNVALIEDKLVVISKPIGVSVYDFNFDLHFRTTHPYNFENEETCVLRVGPIPDYEREFREQAERGLRLVNSPAEHVCASDLETWYEKLIDLTPKSRVFAELPSVDEIETCFSWPVFLKGSRQTSKHAPDLCVINDPTHYNRVSESYRSDPILHWQRPVVREFVPLVPVPREVPGKIKPSLEFWSFWWRGQCVGWGQYWYQIPRYEAADVEVGLSVARNAAMRSKLHSWWWTSPRLLLESGS